MIEPLLLTGVPIFTFAGVQRLTNASGFFFERAQRLFLVTSLHVLYDERSRHFPDRIEIELHNNPANVAAAIGFSIPLYHGGAGVWHKGTDRSGDIDVAVVEIDRGALPENVFFRAFTPHHSFDGTMGIEVGTPLLVVGFPLGFHDTLHHMPVARQAIVASSFGLRFQGQGYFLSDGRTHRGMSGAPVVTRIPSPGPAHGDLAWQLLGIHSARLDVGGRDLDLDEALGLNCAYYADILLTLTQ
jgi:hypothetical protein